MHTSSSPAISASLAAVSVLLAGVGGCGARETEPDMTPAALIVASDSDFVRWAAQPAGVGIAVTVVNSAGDPVRGATVTWAATLGGGSLSPATSVTGATGGAQSTWTLGTALGLRNNAATATVQGRASVTFRASVMAWQEITVGNAQACGLTTIGTGYCWGDNVAGDLGVGDSTQREIPTAVEGGLSFARLSAGLSHTCGLTPAGEAYCWGGNRRGQIGDGTIASRATPVRAVSDMTFVSLEAGGDYTCGVTAAGAAYCWGWNVNGQLGVGDTLPHSGAVAVTGGLVFTSITAGRDNACGLAANGAAYCWGGTASGRQLAPAAVGGGLAFTAISAGVAHTCALTASGAAYCWGDNSRGSLGDGTGVSSADPVPVAGGLSFAFLSASGPQSCGITPSGAAYCWGDNVYGQLGTGSYGIVETAPVAVTGGIAFSRVGTGGAGTCGVSTSGVAYCWGDNGGGTLGDGSVPGHPYPRPVLLPSLP
jgi:alpha-tubulin suppressor-like RCC1 family protein